MFSYSLSSFFFLFLFVNTKGDDCAFHAVTDSAIPLFFMSSYQGQHKNITKLRTNKVTSRAKKERGLRGGRKPCFIPRSYQPKSKMQNDDFCCSNMKSNIHLRTFFSRLNIQHPLVRLILISWEQVPATQLLHLHTMISIWFRFVSLWNPGAPNKCSIITEMQHFSLFIKMNLCLK